ncbi:hypothetical protein Ciccas_008504 [Cichlidogyrus casuarinus]|uniref:Uncharacterized protein n=1 Tax=Cichlidogyrus casuarinus TaxID=1844966 RepID=A0ABD2Q0K5_9PLAT
MQIPKHCYYSRNDTSFHKDFLQMRAGFPSERFSLKDEAFIYNFDETDAKLLRLGAQSLMSFLAKHLQLGTICYQLKSKLRNLSFFDKDPILISILELLHDIIHEIESVLLNQNWENFEAQPGIISFNRLLNIDRLLRFTDELTKDLGLHNSKLLKGIHLIEYLIEQNDIWSLKINNFEATLYKTLLSAALRPWFDHIFSCLIGNPCKKLEIAAMTTSSYLETEKLRNDLAQQPVIHEDTFVKLAKMKANVELLRRVDPNNFLFRLAPQLPKLDESLEDFVAKINVSLTAHGELLVKSALEEQLEHDREEAEKLAHRQEAVRKAAEAAWQQFQRLKAELLAVRLLARERKRELGAELESQITEREEAQKKEKELQLQEDKKRLQELMHSSSVLPLQMSQQARVLAEARRDLLLRYASLFRNLDRQILVAQQAINEKALILGLPSPEPVNNSTSIDQEIEKLASVSEDSHLDPPTNKSVSLLVL